MLRRYAGALWMMIMYSAQMIIFAATALDDPGFRAAYESSPHKLELYAPIDPATLDHRQQEKARLESLMAQFPTNRHLKARVESINDRVDDMKRGRLVGFAGYRLTSQESRPNGLIELNVDLIIIVSITPGGGTRLLEMIWKAVEKLLDRPCRGQISLKSLRNYKTLRFYEKHGFRAQHRIPPTHFASIKPSAPLSLTRPLCDPHGRLIPLHDDAK